MNKNKIFLLVMGLLGVVVTFLGWFNYLQGNFSGLSWPFVWMGVFIWGDGIIVGPFLFFGSVYLWHKNNSIETGMFFSAYVLLRSFIEINYNLNAQFSTTTRPWETFVPQLASNLHLQTTELYVLPQVLYTIICIVALLIFVAYLKKYLKS